MIIATLLIFALITIGCVSAADDIQTDDTVAIDDDTIQEEILTDGNAGSYSELVGELSALQPGDTYELTKDYTYNPDTDSAYKSYGFAIDKSDVTIDGKGHTLSGNGEAGIITDKWGSNLTFKNIIFANAGRGVNDAYSALNTRSSGTVINCTFINNACGGVDFYAESNVINCTFINNSYRRAAAVTYGTVINCTFKDNHYGALDTYFGATVKNCTFINNYAGNQGAAILTTYGMTIEDCTFINNRAASKGGAISKYFTFSDTGEIHINNCTFINNTAWNGPAFTVDGEATWIISNSTFENNNITIKKKYDSDTKGPAAEIDNSMFINSNVTNRFGNLTLSKNTFVDGYVNNNGTLKSQVYFIVPEYNQQNGNPLILLRVVDDNGNSICDGRIPENFISLAIGDEEIPLDNFIKIDGNWYYTTSKELPEGNYNVSISLKNEEEFYKIYSQNSMSNGTLEVGDYSSFADLENAINSAGSVITLTDDYTFDITGEFDLNGIVISRDNIIIDGNGHTINAATVARIFNITGQNVTLRNINFNNGFADKGGAVYSLSDITIENCTFNNNKALDGGALYIANAKIIDSTFIQNIAAEHGGAAYLINANITNSTFTQNKAADNGGALYIKNKGDIKDSKFIENDATVAGAAYINGESDITNVTFTANTAEKAGALYLLGNGNIDQSTFTSNSAERGLAIMNGALLNIANTKFEDGNYNDEIILILDGDVVLNNVSPIELDPIFCVDLYIGGNVTYFGDYNQQAITYDIATRDAVGYLHYVVFDITVMNQETLLNHGIVTMSIGGANYTAEVIGGHAIIPMPMIDAGNYTITFAYNGGDNYQKPIAQKNLTINKRYTRVIPGQDPNAGYIASLSTDPDDVRICGEELIFCIDNKVNVTAKTNNDGVALLVITPSLVKLVGSGYKDAVVYFNGNKNLFGSNGYLSIFVYDSGINPPGPADSINSNGVYSTVITDDLGMPLAGETVVLIVGDSVIATAVTDANGVVTFNIPEDIMKQLKSGNATISLSYNSNGYPHIIDKNVTIKPDPQIVANSASYVINYGGTYSVTLKDANGQALAGKQVTFILNGKILGSAVTNAKGVASFKLTAAMLKAAKAGSRNLAIQFNGDATYSSAVKTVKLTIKKEKTKIAAKKKTFKSATKTKKYTIALKNSKGKAVKKAKVYLKVGKKTYKAKTNSRGKATFKITKLTKKGKYTAKITFKTNAYFLKATKKVRITVR